MFLSFQFELDEALTLITLINKLYYLMFNFK
jgi:hypothetical protein